MRLPFSLRTQWDLGESALSQAIRAARAAGVELCDLTLSNPTACGFSYDRDWVLPPLAAADALRYDPDPRGLAVAREAVAGYYAEHDAELSPGQCVLTTSTSEAYSFLFRLLCDPADEVLVAQPGYPLFDFLAALDDVALKPYTLFYDFGWWIDFAALERQLSPRTRALVLVHPNNPTGHGTVGAERERLEEFCVRHGLALIVDEVFLDYSLGEPLESFARGPHACMTFVVSGLSKIAALPQMKVAWIACCGPERVREEALHRLEMIADTFLSLNAPCQLALPAWLEGRRGIQEQILGRVRENLRRAEESRSMRFLPVSAGWSAVARLPALTLDRGPADDEGLAGALVQEAGVVVHPGSFYGLAGRTTVVVSLLGSAGTFRSGMQRLEHWCESKELTF